MQGKPILLLHLDTAFFICYNDDVLLVAEQTAAS
jgi:hypothetical protein